MNYKALLFPIIGLFFLFGIHIFLYYTTLSFFSISSHAARSVLAILFGFLSISFIIGAILVRFSDNIIFRAFYALSFFWIGLMMNLLLVAIIAWVIIIVLKYFELNIKFIIGFLAYSLALFYCLYGVWNAWHPIIKNIEVEITDLPSSWQGKTIVHLSDLHLGRIHRVLFAEKVVEQVNNLNPDLVVITGDLFDGMGNEPGLFINTLNKLKADKGTYFVTGNHEVYLGTKRILEILEDSNINVLDNELVHIDGLQIIGVSYPELGESHDSNIIENMAEHNPDMPSILLYHSPTSIEQKEGKNNNQHYSVYLSPNTDFTSTKKSGIDLQLSGHTHAGQVFPSNLIAKWIYQGYSYGLFKEGNFTIYTTSGVGTWGPPIRTGNQSEIVKIRLK